MKSCRSGHVARDACVVGILLLFMSLLASACAGPKASDDLASVASGSSVDLTGLDVIVHQAVG